MNAVRQIMDFLHEGAPRHENREILKQIRIEKYMKKPITN